MPRSLATYVDAVSGVYVPHVENAGVENLSVNGGDDDNVDFNYCAYCWAKGVRIVRVSWVLHSA